MQPNKPDPPKLPGPARFVGAVVGFAFALIGITVIGWLWLQPFGFMHPPLFFRLFGSMIALVFVAVGGTMGVGALRGDLPGSALHSRFHTGILGAGARGKWRGGGYKCPSCGAGLSDGADVSPSGDVKCGYCNTWFNVHHP